MLHQNLDFRFLPMINGDELVSNYLTADSRRFSETRIRIFHRRDAEYAEVRSFAQSGDDDWAKDLVFMKRHVFVCRRLPTSKKLILCALCASAVIFLKGFLSVCVCVSLLLIAFDPLCLCLSIALGVLRLSKDASHPFRLHRSNFVEAGGQTSSC